ncbi:MAG TPA: hypothetical protein ENN61_02805, partial [Bacteroidaceae bacterium]|nr:hypothetical protein [Bacteroidaceae bacterium]
MPGSLRKSSIAIVILMKGICLMGQVDYSWWNEKHNWDGVSNWTDYLIITPAYMGPNALPVPDLTDGILATNTS